jgi:hypothetical protein
MLKFAEILTKEDLVDYFEGKKFDTIEVEIGDGENSEANKNLRIDELKALINQDIRNADKKTILKSDAFFSNQIFKQLQYYPRRELTDIRFWQYIGLEYLQNYIWFRWSKSVKNNVPLKNVEKIKIIKSFNKDENEIWSSITTRFLGGTSLKSLTSRNAISRLFWPRQILEDKELVKLCFEKQDIAVAVFERQYGMHPDAAKAFIKNISKKHAKLEKKNIQQEAKKLNRYFATINADYLDQNSIKKLIFI